jgi:hypothetical protein
MAMDARAGNARRPGAWKVCFGRMQGTTDLHLVVGVEQLLAAALHLQRKGRDGKEAREAWVETKVGRGTQGRRRSEREGK